MINPKKFIRQKRLEAKKLLKQMTQDPINHEAFLYINGYRDLHGHDPMFEIVKQDDGRLKVVIMEKQNESSN